LYDGDTVIDDCEIDPSEYSGQLVIKTYTVAAQEDPQVGTWQGQTNEALGVYELALTMNAEEMVSYYNVKTTGGEKLLGDTKLPISSSFRYLSLASGSLSELVICFYDDSGSLMYEATLDTSDGTIQKKTE
jgi:hypothetical protein